MAVVIIVGMNGCYAAVGIFPHFAYDMMTARTRGWFWHSAPLSTSVTGK